MRGSVWRGVLRNLDRAGRSYWVDSTILPLRAEDGPTAHHFKAILTAIPPTIRIEGGASVRPSPCWQTRPTSIRF
ncbi:hypothetical protein ROS217_14836 [Roseovarius sp. 217]|nr:hypothetical protein ROS217_14836 [Roseovarius sp. 217]